MICGERLESKRLDNIVFIKTFMMVVIVSYHSFFWRNMVY